MISLKPQLEDRLLQLRDCGDPLTGAELSLLVKTIGEQPALWVPELRMPDGERSWRLLHSSDTVDVWLLLWLPGHTTRLHDHGSSLAAFTVVRGLLEEIRPTPTGGRTAINRTVGQTVRIEPGVIHDVRAVFGAPAASIHAYSPPLREMTYWEAGPDGRLLASRTVQAREGARLR